MIFPKHNNWYLKKVSYICTSVTACLIGTNVFERHETFLLDFNREAK